MQDVACLVADLEAENSWAAKTTALLSINDEGGETPPQMGERNSSEGLKIQAWCSQGYTTMLLVKPSRP